MAARRWAHAGRLTVRDLLPWTELNFRPRRKRTSWLRSHWGEAVGFIQGCAFLTKTSRVAGQTGWACMAALIQGISGIFSVLSNPKLWRWPKCPVPFVTAHGMWSLTQFQTLHSALGVSATGVAKRMSPCRFTLGSCPPAPSPASWHRPLCSSSFL